MFGKCVSIHTPTKGVTSAVQTSTSRYRFQSTHPRRVWLNNGMRLDVLRVSIHTPTKGVTWPSEGGCTERVFQSTHPRRVWPQYGCTSNGTWSFNPHTHEGCDSRLCTMQQIAYVSIHTPTKGVTYDFEIRFSIELVSIHTPTKGVTFSCYTFW